LVIFSRPVWSTESQKTSHSPKTVCWVLLTFSICLGTLHDLQLWTNEIVGLLIDVHI
jgi:hypothetical protein